MSTSSIITASGKITDEIYHLDIEQYSMPRSCSIYFLVTPKLIIIMDVGTSDDINSILLFMKKNNLPFKKIKYLVPSHHHFDHFGGGWKLWEIISKSNPEIKILTTEKTKRLLQNPKDHMNRAKRTFGDFIGVMKPISDEAYEILETDEPIQIPGLSKEFKLISTPGHTSDHVSPSIINDNKTEFIYLSECAGGLLHSQKLKTVPSSMPPEFDFKTYLKSLQKIIDLEPFNAGYAHAGVVRGQDKVIQVLTENQEYSRYFRDFVKMRFLERRETRYVVEQFIEHELSERSDIPLNSLYTNYVVAVVYGQLIDLGLRKPK